jgi:hypothetical protein
MSRSVPPVSVCIAAPLLSYVAPVLPIETSTLNIWTSMNEDMPVEERRQLEDYQRLSALFQFYLELVLKAFTFALGIAGGVAAFLLGKDVHDRPLAAYGLLLPAVLCIGMGAAFLRAVHSSLELNEALQTLKNELHRSLAPHATNLTAALKGFGILLIICGIILVGLWGTLAFGLDDHPSGIHAQSGQTSSSHVGEKSVCTSINVATELRYGAFLRRYAIADRYRNGFGRVAPRSLDLTHDQFELLA